MKIIRKKHKVEVPSVAMGDIAFNLLIFFVILARATDDSHLNWTPASSSCFIVTTDMGALLRLGSITTDALGGRPKLAVTESDERVGKPARL